MVATVKRVKAVEQTSKAHTSKKSRKPIDRKVESVALPYFNEMKTLAGATRLSLKTARDYNSKLAPQLTAPIGVLGLVSVYSVLQTPKNTYQALKRVHENYVNGDGEGVFFDSIDSAQAVAGGLDALTVLWMSLKELKSTVVVPKFLEAIFLPLAIASTAVDVVTRGTKIFQTKSLMNEMKLSRSGNRFRADALTKRHFIRLTSKQIYKSMKSGKKGMVVARSFVERKLKLELSNQALDITTLVLLNLLFTTVAPYIVLGGLAFVTLCKIALMVYVKNCLYAGLSSPSTISGVRAEFLDTN